jgi:glycerol uptake facilitator-like aquaporin
MPKGLSRELLAEFFGTFILIVFGVGVVAQVVLSKNTAGTFLSINIAWGLAVTMGCYVSAGVRQVLGAQGTAGIWATYPQPFLSVFPGGVIDQVVGTALLVAGIFGITDSRNSPAPAGLAPVVVGLLVVLIGATFGFNSGYAINPARDFGPRLFTFVAGWGGDVFRAGNGWWWVPVVAPCAGGVIGGWTYDAFVGNRFPSHDA